MDLSFLGATRTVTGSCFLVAVGDKRVMIDCGLYQGLPQLEERNYAHPGVDWAEVDAILLTHAHLDHSGLIPRAVKLGYRGPIWAHSATVDLADIMLRDSADIHEQDAEWLSRKRRRAGKYEVEPLFGKKDVEDSLGLFRRVEYTESFEVVPGVKAELRDAGHILGSASIALDIAEDGLRRRIVFSGDVGNHHAPILREPEGFEEADAVLIESTYGDKLHESPEDRRKRLREIINDAHANRGKVIIPAFTVGRTQELLYILGEMLNRDEIPPIPIFLDSPMAIAATEVHERHPECFDRETVDRINSGDNPFSPRTLTLAMTVDESRNINRQKDSAVIIAGGGMCEGGRIVHHLKHGVYQPQNYVVFVGYQAEGTLGRVIQRGEKRLRLFGEEIRVKAKVTSIDSFSAHADRAGLLDWLRVFRKAPEVVFIVHGDERPGEELAEHVRKELGYTAYQPRLGQNVDLADLENVAVAKRRFVATRTPNAADVREIVARVSMLGGEFQSAIEGYVGQLGRRIRSAEQEGHEPHWRTEDVRETLEHLAEAVDADLDTLERLMAESEEADSHPPAAG